MKTPFYWELQKLKPELLVKIKNYFGDNLVGVAIFGSAARGDLSSLSDIDIIVILKECKISIRERIREFWEKVGEEITVLGFILPLSPFIYTEEEVKEISPFFFNFLESIDIVFEKNNSISSILQKMKTYLNTGKIKQKSMAGKTYWQYGN